MFIQISLLFGDFFLDHLVLTQGASKLFPLPRVFDLPFQGGERNPGRDGRNRDPFDLSNFSSGIPYSLAILFILTCHEFGHYFAARHHGIAATLPYFIPFPNLPNIMNFGTLGAVIRTKSPVPSKRVMTGMAMRLLRTQNR